MSDVATTTPPAVALDQVVIQGDLGSLSVADRVRYYAAVCSSLGLNPLTKPFLYLHLNGKLILYASRDCTDQLRKIHGVSITKLEPKVDADVYAVIAYGTDKDGRSDAATGAVSIGNLRGEARANAVMKAETKAKRRLTLSLCGLGMLDETEVESVPGARTIGETERPASIDADGVVEEPDEGNESTKPDDPRATLDLIDRLRAQIRPSEAGWKKVCRALCGTEDLRAAVVDPAALDELLTVLQKVAAKDKEAIAYMKRLVERPS
jgi:hypothetical protein